MFSFISKNWKGTPLVSFEAIIKLIGATKTKKGLSVAARLDENEYLKGIKFPDEVLAKLHMESHDLHLKWNYTISPKSD